MVTTTTVPAGVLASLTQADYLAVDPTLGTVAGEQKTIHEFAWAETVVTVTPPVDHSVAAGQDKIYRLVSRSNSKRFMNERHPGSRTRAIKLSAELADGSLTST
jgi:hypothetical protein